jgi:hypothetical protein
MSKTSNQKSAALALSWGGAGVLRLLAVVALG